MKTLTFKVGDVLEGTETTKSYGVAQWKQTIVAIGTKAAQFDKGRPMTFSTLNTWAAGKGRTKLTHVNGIPL